MPPRSKLGEIPRQDMPTRSAEERRMDFKEVPLGYTEEQALKEALRCLDCKIPHCMEGCPAKVKIPEFIGLVADGKFLEAAKKIKETNALPAACGRVCPQETQCEERCVVGKKFEPVAIGKLEMFVADYERKNSEHEDLKVEQNGKKVCVIGAGPAGLACAGDLIKLGYDVTVLEALHTIGGVLMYGIPEFRLPKELVAHEVENLKRDGVKFKINEVAGISIDFGELRKEYDAVFLGTGAGLPLFLNVPGEQKNEETKKRLQALCKTTDGFKIAEQDLALRGPGDFFGSRQHGLPLLKVASLQMDLETLRDAQQAAAAVIQTADSLNAPELAPLKARVEALFTRQEVSLN